MTYNNGILPRRDYDTNKKSLVAIMGKNRFEYDVGLSFAGEQRDYVREVANDLRSRGIKVFYDDNEQVNLWGKELNVHLSNIYQNKCQYCVVFISEEYVRKVWTNLERQSAQARAIIERNEYILPVRIDDTSLPGMPHTVSYIYIGKLTPLELSELIANKIGKTTRENHLPVNLNRLFERLDMKEELELQELVRRQADAFFNSLTKMNVAERLTVISLVTYGCPAELPDNIHIHSDLLRRQTGKSVNQLKRLLGGVASLGFNCWIEEGCDEDVKTISNNNLFFYLKWIDLTVYDEPKEIVDLTIYDEPEVIDEYPEMFVVSAMIEIVSEYYCPKHAMETLKVLDFSQLSDETKYSEYDQPV